jgi:hypothetical protein
MVVVIFLVIKAARLQWFQQQPKEFLEEAVHCLAWQWDASLNAKRDCF